MGIHGNQYKGPMVNVGTPGHVDHGPVAGQDERLIMHEWECISPGMYDFTYECKKCGKFHCESADNPATALPEFGCSACCM